MNINTKYDIPLHTEMQLRFGAVSYLNLPLQCKAVVTITYDR